MDIFRMEENGCGQDRELFCFRVGAQPAGDFLPIDSRHHDIHDDEVWFFLLRPLKTFQAIGRFHNLMTQVFELAFKDIPIIIVVFNNQNFQHTIMSIIEPVSPCQLSGLGKEDIAIAPYLT